MAVESGKEHLAVEIFEFLQFQSITSNMRSMATPLLTLAHMDTNVRFYHQSDERAFFEWLSRISCVASYAGDGQRGLVVKLKRRPGEDDLRQLLALCHRYRVNMRQLAKFETDKNRSWLRNPDAFWYRGVFGKSQDRSARRPA